MKSVVVKIDLRRITGWDAFHDVFTHAFGFPDFYGRNMNAWIDCMTYLDDPDAGMTTVHAPPGGVVVLHLEYVKSFREEHPEIYAALIESSAFVNFRRVEQGDDPVLALSFNG